MEDTKEILSRLTDEEKVSLLSGKSFWLTRDVPRLGVPSVKMTDGPHGTREEINGTMLNVMKDSVPSTCFPALVVYAASWDRELAAECSRSIAEEAMTQGISTVLAPGTNIKRSPLCGRNFEYFSEDPYLAAEMATAFVNGLQSTGVGCSLKHFCANNQENSRMSVNAVVDERAMREIYLPAFEHTVKRTQPSQIMCSYNRLNGTYLSDNKRYLTDILRDEWGFKGMVVSDWGAVNDRVAGVRAGMDLEMPGNGEMNSPDVLEALGKGEISREELDACAGRVLEYVDRSVKAIKKDYVSDYAAHHATARRMAAAGAVLLKNDDALLPLDKAEKVTIIGALAETPRYQGGGSSQIHPKNLVSLLDALRAENISFDYCPGYSLKGDGYNKKLLKQAVDAAGKADKVVVVVGLTPEYESEGFDRTSMDLPVGHNKLVSELAKVNDKLAVVLVCGSPVTLPWTKKVRAILNIYVGGEAGGEGAADVLFGKVNPSGKLPETFPKRLSDNISNAYFPMGPVNVQYRESVFVGYRYYDTAGKAVRYPFGHGLSYTEFKYSGLKLSKKKIADTDGLTVSFAVENTGKVPGAEVAQLYVSDLKSTAYRPEKELKGFEKVFLQPGEKKTVEIKLDRRAFAFWNVLSHDWTVESGDFAINVGASSRDLRLSAVVSVEAPGAEIADHRKTAPVYYDLPSAEEFPVEQFAAVYGGEVPENKPPVKGEFDVNSTVEEISVVPLGRFLKKVLTTGARVISRGAANRQMAVNSIVTAPIRSFCAMAGALSKESTFGLVDMLNGTKGGLGRFLRGFKRPKKQKKEVQA